MLSTRVLVSRLAARTTRTGVQRLHVAASHTPTMVDRDGSWRTGGQPNGSTGESGPGGSKRTAASGKSRQRGGAGGGRNVSARPKAGGVATASSVTAAAVLPNLPLPLHNAAFMKEEYFDVYSGKIKQSQTENPKAPLQNYVNARTGSAPVYKSQEGFVGSRREPSVRSTVVADEAHNIIGYGDAKTQREAEKLAALDAILQLARHDLLNAKPPPLAKTNGSAAANKANTAGGGPQAKLSDGTAITAERAREFMDFYCKHFNFGKPDIQITEGKQTGGRKAKGGWEAEMRVGGQKIGMASASSKKLATTNLYLDTVTYLESFDAGLWKTFSATSRAVTAIGGAPAVSFNMSDELDNDVREVYNTTKQSLLFANRPRPAGLTQAGEAADANPARKKKNQDNRGKMSAVSDKFLEEKSERLLRELEEYQVDSRMVKMREQRNSLPVYMKASDVLVKIELNQISIVMAATGSGKTTQIPQILFDDYILQHQGAKCNIICTQPRRIAAISVAERVAKERGETAGKTVGYQVRFENKTPQPHGSITFCTTGVFLRRLQSALDDEDATNTFLDNLTHIVLDEVHERDLETDLLLVVLKKVLQERKQLGKKEIKLVLMSATIDPKMFCEYFADPVTGVPAPVVEVSGRSFPVTRHYLEDIYHELDAQRLPVNAGGWVFNEKNVREYLDRELQPDAGMNAVSARNNANGESEGRDFVDDLELPYPLIALMIAQVIQRSTDGHVLCFLPGWDEIKKVNLILEETYMRPLMGINFMDRSKFEIHILHSSIPVADQQAIFEPPPAGVRRIILSTNIAETSVTIPDVVYVIDTGRVKESRYDPERHLSSLVSAWVGTSNINQRAGRAGRHRPGEAYAVFSKARYDRLKVSSTVEMKRVDLSNVVMHIKALDIPGMDVEDVLAAAIEPPGEDRVRAALEKLAMVGALDANHDLTSLGRVLLQLPVDAPIGKMCLYGAFFRCLDPCLTLAAVLTTRDPWMAPMALKEEAGVIKNSWTMSDFRSDPLVTLRAFTRWDALMKRGSQYEAIRFCNENFLARTTMSNMQQVKEHMFQSMEKAGILDTILGLDTPKGGGNGGPAARRRPFRRLDVTMPELNTNSGSVPLLAALIALSSMPNFAVRTKQNAYRTSQDKSCQIHPSSVQHLKHTRHDETYTNERDLFAFNEKIKNISQAGGGGGGPTMLRTVTRLDPLTYMLFGAGYMRPSNDGGLLCDNWLPITGNFDALDDVERLKAILDVCMLRVFEAISPDGGEGGGGAGAKRLEPREVQEFEQLTKSVVHVLDNYSRERLESASRDSTRPATPIAMEMSSGRSTPYKQSRREGGGGGVGLLRFRNSGTATPP